MILMPDEDGNFPPKYEREKDHTNCSHIWEPMNGSYMIPKVDDFICTVCGAHGQKDFYHSDQEIKWCHGGKVME